LTAPDDSDLVRAHGKFVAFLASLLQGRGLLAADEFAALLSAFAETVGESEPREGEILAYWAEVVREFRGPGAFN
jgi:hypothetical protein